MAEDLISLEQECGMIQEQIQKHLDFADQLAKLLLRFPDLQKHTDKYKNVRYFSKRVNAVADCCEIVHTCSCCSDSALDCWPYKEIDGMKIYSDPPAIYIGDRAPLNGDLPRVAWKDAIRCHGISEEIVKRVGEYFSQNRPEFEVDLTIDDLIEIQDPPDENT